MKAPHYLIAVVGIVSYALVSQGFASTGGGMDRFTPGEVWLDTDGKPIQAHGGAVLVHDGTYY